MFLNFNTNYRHSRFEIKNFAREDDKNNAVLVNIGNLKSKLYKDHVKRVFHQGYTTSEPYYLVTSKPRNKFMADFGALQSSYYISGYMDIILNNNYQKIMNEEKWEKSIPVYKMISKSGEVLLSFTHKMNYNLEERFVNKDKYMYNRFKLKKAHNVTIGNSRSNKKCVRVSTKYTYNCPKICKKEKCRINKDHKNANDTFRITFDNPGEVCAQRTDSKGGWGMKLKFRCNIIEAKTKTITIGNSKKNTKCVKADTAKFNWVCNKVCRRYKCRINRDHWSAKDTHKITVDTKKGQICAKRMDSRGGWGLKLKFRC